MKRALCVSLTFVVFACIACGDAFVNPYDEERAPAHVLKRGRITGKVALEGRSEYGGVKVRIDPLGAGLDGDGVETQGGGGENNGRFTSHELPAGTYNLTMTFEGFEPRSLNSVELKPGQDLDVGLVVLPVARGVAAGTVVVEEASSSRGVRVVLSGEFEGGTRRSFVTFSQPDGSFSVENLPAGNYVALADLLGYTPDESQAVAVSSVHTVSEPAQLGTLRLSPAGQVIAVIDTAGSPLHYTATSQVQVEVHAFGSRGPSALEVRLSEDAGLAGIDETQLAFGDLNSPLPFTLSDQEGEHRVYAQFRWRETGEPVATLFESRVVLDQTPPVALSVVLAPNAQEIDGVRYITGSLAAVPLEVSAVDLLSTVAGVRLAVEEQDIQSIPFTPLTGGASITFYDLVSLSASDGVKHVAVQLTDGAGNLSELFADQVVVDTTAPVLQSDPAIEVPEAVGLELRTRRVTLDFLVGGDQHSGADGPARMRYGEIPLTASEPVPFGPRATVDVIAGHGETVQFRGIFEDRVGNTVEAVSRIYTINLRGTVVGRVQVEGETLQGGDHSGVLVQAFLESDLTTVQASAQTIIDGSFSLADLSEGNYRLVYSGPGFHQEVRSGMAARSGEVSDAGVVLITHARGLVYGRFRYGDVGESADDNGGITVTAYRGTAIVASTQTRADGTYLFDSPQLPVADDYRIAGSAPGYLPQEVLGVVVQESETTVINPSATSPEIPDPMDLPKQVGDFKICDRDDPNQDDTCTPILYTNKPEVLLGLRAENVTEVRIKSRATFADPADNSLWSPYAPGNAYLADITSGTEAADQGRAEVFVQFRSSSETSSVLTSEVVYDTYAPFSPALTIDRGAAALLDGFTNHPTGEVTLRFNAAPRGPSQPATTAVAPVASVIVSRDDVLDAGDASKSFGLPGVFNIDPASEGTKTVYAWFCDGAENCTDPSGPASAAIVYDATPPRTANGVDYTPVSPVLVEHGGQYYTRSSQYSVRVDVGTAADALGTPVTNLAGGAVADVIGYRFGFDEHLLDAFWQNFSTIPAPGGTATVVGPSLAGVDGDYTVYAQFMDAAGNTTDVENNAYLFDLTLDTAAPGISLTLNGDAPYSNDAAGMIELTVQVAGSDPPVRVWLSQDDGRFDTYTERAMPLTDTSFDLSAAAPPDGDGIYTVYARFFDAAGNTAERSDSIFLDRTAPSAASVRCTSCSEYGATVYANDGLGQVSLELFAQDNSGIVDTIDVRVDGSPQHQGDPYAPVYVATLSTASGSHDLEVDFFDLAGNSSRAGPLTIVYDAEAPVPAAAPLLVLVDDDGDPGTPTTALADGGLVNSRALQLRVDVTGADLMQLSELPGCTAGAVEPLTDPAAFTIAPDEGVAKRIYGRFSDRAGNTTSCVSSRSFFLDSTAPDVGLAQIGDGSGLVDSRSVQVRVDASDASTGFAGAALFAHLSRDGAFAPDDGDGERYFTLEADGSTLLPFSLLEAAVAVGDGDGLRTVFLRVIDAAGNTTQRALSVQLDETAPPRPQPVAPVAGSYVTTQTPTFQWSAAVEADHYLLEVRRLAGGQPVIQEQTSQTSFTATAVLANDDYEWEVRAVDSAGNDSGLDASFPVTFVLDASAPTGLAGLAVVGGTPSSDNTPQLQWSAAADPGGQTPAGSLSYVVELSATAAFAAIDLAATVVGTTSYTVASPLPDGTWHWRVRVTDLAGNNDTVVATDPFVIDTEAPQAVSLEPVAALEAPPVVLRWSLPADPDRVGVRLQVSTQSDFGTTLINSLEAGTSRDITASLSNGNAYYARVAAEDALGNREFLSVAQFIYDDQAPSLGGSPVVLLDARGNTFAVDALIVDRSVQLSLDAGEVGEEVAVLLSNASNCANPTEIALDTSDGSPDVVPWTLAPGGAFKYAYARFVDAAGNTTACTASQRVRSTGTLIGRVDVSAGASGLTISGGDRAGVVVSLSNSPVAVANVVTDAAGDYRFTAVPITSPAAAYTLDFAKQGFDSPSTSVTAVADTTTTASNVTMTVRTGTMSGNAQLLSNTESAGACGADPQNSTSVVLTLEGTAFTGASVSRTENPAANGDYTFSDVPAGTYALLPSRDGYLPVPAHIGPIFFGPGATLSNQDFDLTDTVAPEPPVIHSETDSPTSSSSASLAIDLGSSDATTPTSNLRGYHITRIDFPLPGVSGSPVETDLGAFAPASSISVALVNNRQNRFLVTGVDCCGNASTPSEVVVVRDSDAPSTSGASIAIDSPSGNGFTNSVSVTLQLVPPSDATQIQVANDTATAGCTSADVSGVTAQQINTTMAFVLTAGDGNKRVCARFLDQAGNPSSFVSDTITLDTLAPSAPLIITEGDVLNVPDGSAFAVTTFGAVTEANFWRYERLGGQASNWTADSTNISTTSFTYNLASRAGDEAGVPNLLRLRAVDLAGNPSPEASIIVTTDINEPEPVTLNVKWVRNRDRSVTVYWQPSSSPDVVAHNIYYGSSPGNYDGQIAAQGASPVRVGAVTSAVLSGISNGSPLHISVRPLDRADNEGPEPATDEVLAQPGAVAFNLIDNHLTSMTAVTRLANHGHYLYAVGYSGDCNASTARTELRVLDVQSLESAVRGGEIRTAPALPTQVFTTSFADNLDAYGCRFYAPGIQIDGPYLYLVAGTRLRIYSLLTPDTPALVTTLNFSPMMPTAVHTRGRNMFLSARASAASHTGYLIHLDISELYDEDPATLPDTGDQTAVSSGRTNMGGLAWARDHMVQFAYNGGNSTYWNIADAIDGNPATVFNTSDRLGGHWDFNNGDGGNPIVSGNLLYLANASGLRIFDLSNEGPGGASLWDGTMLRDRHAIAAQGGKAEHQNSLFGGQYFLGDTNQRAVRCLDVSDLPSIAELGIFRLPDFGDPNANLLLGNYLFVGTSQGRIYSLEVAAPRSLHTVTNSMAGSTGHDMMGSFVVHAHNSVVDLQSGWPPPNIGAPDQGGCVYDNAVFEDVNVAAHTDMLRAINLDKLTDRDPDTTFVSGSDGYTVSEAAGVIYTTGLTTYGNFLIAGQVRSDGCYVEVFDATDLRDRQASTILDPSDSRGSYRFSTYTHADARVFVEMHDGRALLGIDQRTSAPATGFFIVDLRPLFDDDSSTVLDTDSLQGSVNLNQIHHVKGKGDYAYAASSDAFYIVDINQAMDEDPATKVPASPPQQSVSMYAATAVEVYGSYALVMPSSTSGAALRAIDVTVATSPSQIGYLPVASSYITCGSSPRVIYKANVSVGGARAVVSTYTGTSLIGLE